MRERCMLKQVSQVFANERQTFLAHADDIVLINPDLSRIGPHERHNQFEGDALASTAAPEQTQGLTLIDMKRHVIQYAFCTERLHHMLKLHRNGLGLAHMAVSGKRKKMHLISNTSATMINREERTTLLVAASPTPCAPLSVV